VHRSFQEFGAIRGELASEAQVARASKENATATPRYTVLSPWRDPARRRRGREN